MANFEYEIWFTPNAPLIRTTTSSESYRYPGGVYIVVARGNRSFQEGTFTDVFPIQDSEESDHRRQDKYSLAETRCKVRFSVRPRGPCQPNADRNYHCCD